MRTTGFGKNATKVKNKTKKKIPKQKLNTLRVLFLDGPRPRTIILIDRYATINNIIIIDTIYIDRDNFIMSATRS